MYVYVVAKYIHTANHLQGSVCVRVCVYFKGFLFQFVIFCFLGILCFHLFHLFHALAFPYQAKKWMDSRRIRIRIHITEVLIVLVSGSVPPIVTINVSDYMNNGLFCQPRSTSAIFYGIVLPDIIGSIIGFSLLFSCIWIIHQVSS